MTAERSEPSSDQVAIQDRTFRRGAILGIGVVLLIGILLGFLVLPVVQGTSVGVGAWTAICRAVGVQPGTPVIQQPAVTAVPHPVSQVSWGTDILAMLRNANVRNGEQVAARCAACHGNEGLAPSKLFPNLAGQTDFAIYKQLQDYRSGARPNDGMQAVVRYLDNQAMADVAAYYASHAASRSTPTGNEAITNLAVRGDPSRSIAACDECHVNRPEAPIEAPYLMGQHDQYLVGQLQAFAHQNRTNDVYARMRAIAASLTADEIAGLAAYYGVTKSR